MLWGPQREGKHSFLGLVKAEKLAVPRSARGDQADDES